MGTIDDKIYSDRKQEEPKYTHEWVEDKVKEFLKSGGIAWRGGAGRGEVRLGEVW